MPTLSVLTPSYNDGRFLPECLTSVREAAAKAERTVQHIVVDDGSTDGTPAVLAQYPEVTVSRFPENRGCSAALNAALWRAHGDWCLILAADDAVTETAFSEWLLTAVSHPSANVVYSDLEFFGERRGRYCVPAFESAVLGRRNILPGAAFIRRDLLTAVGGFDEALRSAQDWDFWVRVDLAVGLVPVKVAVPLVRYRWHRDGRLHNESARNQDAIRNHIRRLVERAA